MSLEKLAVEWKQELREETVRKLLELYRLFELVSEREWWGRTARTEMGRSELLLLFVHHCCGKYRGVIENSEGSTNALSLFGADETGGKSHTLGSCFLPFPS